MLFDHGSSHVLLCIPYRSSRPDGEAKVCMLTQYPVCWWLYDVDVGPWVSHTFRNTALILPLYFRSTPLPLPFTPAPPADDSQRMDCERKQPNLRFGMRNK